MPSRILLLAALLLLPIAPAHADGPTATRASRELRTPDAFRGRAPRRGAELRVPRGFRRHVTEPQLRRERRADLRDPWARRAPRARR